MPVDKYKFISPGVFLQEIDNTGLTATPQDRGPALIGRASKGPILKPIKVNSYIDFQNTFGAPVPGGKGGDISRNGNYTAPTYGPYAAEAWFKNNSPITYVRLGGQQHGEFVTDAGEAGWRTAHLAYTTDATTNGGAYGLFVADAPNVDFELGFISPHTATLAANDFIEIGDGKIPPTIRHISCSMVSPPTINEFQFVTGASDFITCNNIVEAITAGSSPVVATNPAGAVVLVVTGDGTLYGAGGTNGNGPTLSVSGALSGLALTASITQPGGAPDVVLANEATGTISGSVTGSVGCHAATWYLDKDTFITLSGTKSCDGDSGTGTSIYFDSVGFRTFNVLISQPAAPVITEHTNFDFNSTGDLFIRNQFNTNPTLNNNQVVDTTGEGALTNYWLGESYEGMVNQTLQGTSDGSPHHIGVILPLRNAATLGGNFQKQWQDAETGWFFAQDTQVGESATGSYDPSEMPRLFKLVARNSGDWIARKFKVSIKDLKRSSDVFNKYGSFTVALRQMDDTDNRVEFVEQFNNCNLNPTSENFIGRKIGDKFVQWSDEERAYREFGDYPNLSQYIRVEINELVKKGDSEPELLPFGVRGPLRFATFQDFTGTVNPSYVSGNFDDAGATVTGFISGATDGQMTFDFPKLRMRVSASEGDPVDARSTYFGVDTTFGNGSRLEASVLDHLKIKPLGVSEFNTSTTNSSSISSFFTLDDMCNTSTTLTGTNVYISGSRRLAKSGIAGVGDTLTYSRDTGSYVTVLETAGVDRFTTVFFGGFDGLNIKEAEPFSNRLLEGVTPQTSYELNSVQVAIDSLRDPEVVEYNLAAMPGIKSDVLNRALIDLCESRGDALAVIDIKHAYDSAYESVATAEDRLPNVNQAVLALRNNLAVNSSYGTAYFPWVQIRDTISGQFVWIPPSVVALGAISHGERTSELWFAPAGFTRGSLSKGHGGLAVVNVRTQLTSKERDTLYQANINPIASFPKEGIVIYGQKTLKMNASALDRINVRRLLIFLKRRVSRFAATLLFAQNVRTTWNRFRGVVEPFLATVQARLGIAEFKLVLDETTTTPELIDQNVLYAKIYIKPVRGIEFIAIDFILTDSGAAFVD